MKRAGGTTGTAPSTDFTTPTNPADRSINARRQAVLHRSPARSFNRWTGRLGGSDNAPPDAMVEHTRAWARYVAKGLAAEATLGSTKEAKGGTAAALAGGSRCTDKRCCYVATPDLRSLVRSCASGSAGAL
jgi:hypothetical protein